MSSSWPNLWAPVVIACQPAGERQKEQCRSDAAAGTNSQGRVKRLPKQHSENQGWKTCKEQTGPNLHPGFHDEQILPRKLLQPADSRLCGLDPDLKAHPL